MLGGDGAVGAIRGVLDRGRSLGFLGTGSIDRHIAHALGFAAAYEASAPRPRRTKPGTQPSPPRSAAFPGVPERSGPTGLVDLGSGVGLPGIVLAMVWRSCEVQLVEASSRRAQFLEDAVRQCGLEGRVTIRCERAEMVARLAAIRGQQELAVARSFGGPAVTAECGAPMLALDGLLIVSEPPPAPNGPQNRWPAEGLARLGLEDAGLWRGDFGYRVLRAVRPCSDHFPRRAGIPEKRPLF